MVKLNAARTTRSSPIAPPSTSSFRRAVCGLCRYMNASVRIRPVPIGHVEGPLDVVRPPAQWFLAEHVLARLQRADRPLDVHRVRKRDVDGVHVGIGEQLLVAPVCALDVPLPAISLGACEIAARHRGDFHPVGLARTGDDEPVDVRGREDPEAKRHRRDRKAG